MVPETIIHVVLTGLTHECIVLLTMKAIQLFFSKNSPHFIYKNEGKVVIHGILYILCITKVHVYRKIIHIPGLNLQQHARFQYHDNNCDRLYVLIRMQT